MGVYATNNLIYLYVEKVLNRCDDITLTTESSRCHPSAVITNFKSEIKTRITIHAMSA